MITHEAPIEQAMSSEPFSEEFLKKENLIPVEPTQPIRRRECEHGIMEGYHCWRCRGKAVVRQRVQGG